MQCNGLCPCNTCEKRKFQCVYADREGLPEPSQTPTKKRVIEAGQNPVTKPIAPNPVARPASPKAAGEPPKRSPQPPAAAKPVQSPARLALNGNPQLPGAIPSPYPVDESVENAARSLQQFSTPRGSAAERAKSFLSANTSQSGHDEEAVVYSQARMLQDSTGRLCMICHDLSRPMFKS